MGPHYLTRPQGGHWVSSEHSLTFWRFSVGRLEEDLCGDIMAAIGGGGRAELCEHLHGTRMSTSEFSERRPDTHMRRLLA